MPQEAVRRDAGLLEAFDEPTFLVAYEPLFDLARGTLRGLKACARPARRPADFAVSDDPTPRREEDAPLLERRALEAACADSRRWQDEGFDFVLWMSIPTNDLHDPCFEEMLAGILTRTAMNPARLMVEFEDVAFVEHPRVVEARLHAVKELGVCTALKVAGATATYAYPRPLGLDALRIDRSLTATVGREDAPLRSALRLARVQSLLSVAAGIETDGQLRQLLGLGCELGQGSLFSPPLAAPAARALLEHACPIRGASLRRAQVAAGHSSPRASFV